MVKVFTTYYHRWQQWAKKQIWMFCMLSQEDRRIAQRRPNVAGSGSLAPSAAAPSHLVIAELPWTWLSPQHIRTRIFDHVMLVLLVLCTELGTQIRIKDYC